MGRFDVDERHPLIPGHTPDCPAACWTVRFQRKGSGEPQASRPKGQDFEGPSVDFLPRCGMGLG